MVEAALAELGGERGGGHPGDRGQQVGGRVGRARGAAAAVGGLALGVVGVRHRARRAELVVGLGDRGAQPAGADIAAVAAGRAHLDLDQVAGLDHGGTGRGAGEDHVARLERGQPRHVGDDVGEGEQQVVAADRVLRELAVDPGPQRDALRVDDPGVEQRRAERREPVNALGAEVGPPVGVAQVVHAEVVGGGHPAHVRPRVGRRHPGGPGADDERDLALEREQLAPRRPAHQVAVGGQGGRRLEEVRGPRRKTAALHRAGPVADVHGDDLRGRRASQRVFCHRTDRI